MDVRAVNLNLLVALDALLAERSVTRAARRLGVSQPTMSHSLRQLRELLEDPLLVRVAGAFAPTPLARSLLPHLRAGLAEIQQVLEAREHFDPARSQRRFRIAASDYFQVVSLHRLLGELARRAPRVELAIRAPAAETADELASGSLDFVAGSAAQLPGAGFERVELYRERFVVVARRGHPRLRAARAPSGPRITLAGYCAADHALVTRDEEPGFVDRSLRGLGRSRRVALRVPDFAGIGSVVAATDLLATVPERYARSAARQLPLDVCDCPLRLPPFAVSLAWHPRFGAEPGLRWLRELLVSLA